MSKKEINIYIIYGLTLILALSIAGAMSIVETPIGKFTVAGYDVGNQGTVRPGGAIESR